MRIKQLVTPALVTVLLAIFAWLAGVRIVALIKTGQPLAVGIGIAVALVLVAIFYAIIKEWLMAGTVTKMSNELAEQGRLPVDDLPRSAGGRVDPETARSRFDELRAVVESDETNWGGWYNLAFGYDAAGDRKRARAALRTAARLYRNRTVAS